MQRLAHELRELRKAVGNPSYRLMAKTAGVSASSLSQAAAGDRLPSWATVRGYAIACGADPGEWEERWKSAEIEAVQAVPSEDTGSAPYRGLARFEPDDRALFFGRDRLADELMQMVCHRRFAVLVGPSGSGKSSLLRAGLIPRVKEHITCRSKPTVLRLLTPGTKPASTYRRVLAPEEGEPDSWVIVDQFEEVFTLCHDAVERMRFIDLLLRSLQRDSRLRVVVAVRADFYAQCAEHRTLADALLGAGLLVGPMTAEELREAVIRPAAAVGLLVERALTARIVEEVSGEPGALPLLSHAMLETWRRRKGRMLTLTAYEAVGGVRGAIAASAEEVYGRLPVAQARTARQLLLHLVEPGRDGVDTRRPLSRSELEAWEGPETLEVVEQLTRARLVTVQEGDVQLAHEALITGWPRLKGWIEDNRELMREHRRLADAAQAWQESRCDPDALYRGARLERAVELFTDTGPGETLSTDERMFLRASRCAHESERRAATRTARRARFLFSGLSTVVVIALVSAIVAVHLHHDNEQQRIEAAARRVAGVADALRTTDPRTAMALSVAAWRLAPLSESHRALLASEIQPLRDTFTDPAPGDGPDRFLADSGRKLVSVEEGHWRAWDVVTHRLTASGRLPRATAIAAAPGRQVLALRTRDGIRLWNTVTGKWTGSVHSYPVTSTSLRFGGSGQSYLVEQAGTGRLEMRSTKDGHLLFETHVADWTSATTTSDDRFLAVCPLGGSPEVWDLVHRRRLPGSWEQADGLCGSHATLVFANGAQRLIAVTGTTTRVWDTRSGVQTAQLTDPGAWFAAFDDSGGFLATVGGAELRVWRLSSPGAPVFRYPLNGQEVRDLAWDPTEPVVKYLDGSTVRLLDLSGAVTPAWRGEPLSGVELSPDGRVLATAQRSGTRYDFELRDTHNGGLLRTLPAPPLPTSRDDGRPLGPQEYRPVMAFSSDGTTFAYGVSTPQAASIRQSVTVWNLRRNRVRTTLDLAPSVPSPGPLSLALGPGGERLYAARRSAADAVENEVWDVTRRRREGVLGGLASTHLALRPDGRLLVGDNRSARLPSGKVAKRDLAQGGRIEALLFTRDGYGLMAGDANGRVSLWFGDLRNRMGVLRNVFPAPFGDTPEGVSALAVSPDGCTIAVAGDRGSLQLWDTATQQPIGGPLTTGGDSIRTLAFSQDGGTLYAGSLHLSLQRYSIDTDHALHEVCVRAGGDLSRAQWNIYLPEVPYRRVCA
ncbi:hypothetical protein [Streptomyces sp. NPDC046909]|uniref:nSTAND1 domain-containing NTPase n=1 Tax=Streptomyces sp. NPDC046909 TaxID=3155617 RepID=UPI0033ECA30A